MPGTCGQIASSSLYSMLGIWWTLGHVGHVSDKWRVPFMSDGKYFLSESLQSFRNVLFMRGTSLLVGGCITTWSLCESHTHVEINTVLFECSWAHSTCRVRAEGGSHSGAPKASLVLGSGSCREEKQTEDGTGAKKVQGTETKHPNQSEVLSFTV